MTNSPTVPGGRDNDERAWGAARTLADVGALIARWLEGDSPWIPTYCSSSPAAETAPHIVAALARVNRAGWVTGSSQPGRSDGDLRQRAYADGLADPWIARYAEHLSVGTDLVVISISRGEAPGTTTDLLSIPVTASGGRAGTFLGRWDPADLDPLLDAPLSTDAVVAVQGADVLQVFDPVWGRDDVLWAWLRRLADDLTDGTALAWVQQQAWD